MGGVEDSGVDAEVAVEGRGLQLEGHRKGHNLNVLCQIVSIDLVLRVGHDVLCIPIRGVGISQIGRAVDYK